MAGANIKWWQAYRNKNGGTEIEKMDKNKERYVRKYIYVSR